MVEQLSGMDSMFLYSESYRAPLELGSLHIYDPSTAPGGQVRFKEILATFHSRLDRCAVFRQRLLELPLSVDHPYWVIDDDFDLEYHVRHISLPKPGEWRQLMAQVARLQARPLDRSKPLWMAHIIEGLDNVPGLKPGCFAMYLKIHHAAIDGVTGKEVQTALHDLEPIPADASWYEPSSVIESDHEPPELWNLLARVPFTTALKTLRLTTGLAQAAPGLVKTALAARKKEKTPIPRVPFNEGRVSPNRVVDGCFFDLSDIKRMRAGAAGATVNDVALTIVSGALRLYLETKDALPAESLVAACPINVGTEEDADQGRGNLLSLMTPPLHTEIADPLERMQAIHTGTEAAKALLETLGSRTMTQIPMNLPAPLARGLFPLVAELALRTGSLPYNTMITNVAGIQKPLYLAGAKMLRVMGMGPAIDQAGLFHVVFSYNGMVSIAFTACREMLPDPDLYAQCIQAAYDELGEALPGKDGSGRTAAGVKAAEGKSVSRKAPRKKTARKKTAARKTTAKKKATKSAAVPGKKQTAKKRSSRVKTSAGSSKKVGRRRVGKAS